MYEATSMHFDLFTALSSTLMLSWLQHMFFYMPDSFVSFRSLSILYILTELKV